MVLTSFLHEGKEIVEKFLPLRVVADFVQLKQDKLNKISNIQTKTVVHIFSTFNV